MPKIDLRLSSESIMQATAEVRAYARKVESNAKKLENEIALEIGIEAEKGFNGAETADVYTKVNGSIVYEGKEVPDVSVAVEAGDHSTKVVAHGKSAVFQEFGAGVYYNGPAGTSLHPWGPGNVFLIGTYGKGYGAREIWGYYDDDGELKLTHGTPASMPMYHATEKVKDKAGEIARKIFKEGEQ